MTGMAGLPVWLILLRGGHDAMLLSLLGVLAFAPLVLPRDIAPQMAPALRPIALASGGLALLLGSAWFLAEAGTVADSNGVGATFAAVPAFLAYLPFAQVLLARLVLIAAALALVRIGRAALVPAVVAVALQPWLGHAGQVSNALAASETLHLLAASCWLGGLLPLLLCLRTLPAREAALAFRRFTWVGVPAVLTLAGTGLAQGFVLAGGAAGLAGTEYGHVALVKAALFALALLLAARNGLVLTRRFAFSPAVSHTLGWSVGTEGLIGAAIVFIAGWLAGLPPGGG